MNFPRVKSLWRCIALVLCLLWIRPLARGGQAADLIAEERNTVEVFRRASGGVVHISAATTLLSPFEKRTVSGAVPVQGL